MGSKDEKQKDINELASSEDAAAKSNESSQSAGGNRDSSPLERHMPEAREEEIKNIGIIQHLARIGENLQKVYDADELLEEEKIEIYSRYMTVLREDVVMINEQKKGYEEELPPNVLNITKPIDDNMLEVMNRCLSVVNDYISFMEEEEKDIDLIINSFDILEQTSDLLDETEEMLRAVFESVETTGGIIGEA